MGKRIKLYEEFTNSPAQPAVKPGQPDRETETKPGQPKITPGKKPGPIPFKRPATDPAPKAEIDEVVARFYDEIESLSSEEKEAYYDMLDKKYSAK